MKELLLLITVAYCLNGNIKGTVKLPTISAGVGTTADIPCASAEMMKNSSFKQWIKVWRVNQSEVFEAAQMTFVNDNETLRIQSIQHSNGGLYDCCLHAYAYEDFLCFSTELVIPQEDVISALNGGNSSGAAEAKNQTEPPMPPAWNVDMVGMDTLNAVENNTYFLRLFDANVTEIKCVKDGNGTSTMKVSNKFPEPMYTDALIPKFTMATFGGLYNCNGTYKNGNETEIIPMEFEIIESIDSNLHSHALDAAVVKNYRNSGTNAFYCTLLVIVLGRQI